METEAPRGASQASGPALPRRTQLALVAVAAAVVAGALWLSSCAHKREAPAVASSAPADRFTPTREQQGQIQTAVAAVQPFADSLSTDGRIAVDDDRTTQVFPPFTGRVTNVFVVAGQHVRAGQPLAAFAANELVQARSDLASAQAAETQATAQLAQARSNFGRQSALAPAQAAAARDVEQARTDLATAEQSLATARTNAAAARGRLQVLNVAPGAAMGAAQGRAAAVIRAPLDGVVTSRQVGRGQFVNSYTGGSSTPLLVISDLSRVWLVANLRDTDSARVRVGAALTARVPALDGLSVSGRVVFVSPVVDPAAHRVTVRAEVANPDGRLRPDMFADVTVGAGPTRTAVSVPAAAVLYDGSAAKVWVQGPGGAFALRPVQVGRAQGGAVEVVSGLAAGERVASGGALFIDQAATGG